MRTDDFAFDLPVELIAQTPLPERDAARLLVLDRRGGDLAHGRVGDLPRWLRAGDLLILNDTRVLPGRLFARRPSGGRVEFLLLRPEGQGGGAETIPPGGGGVPAWRALAKPLRRVRVGETLALEPAPGRQAPAGAPPAEVRVTAVLGEGEVSLAFGGPLLERDGLGGVLTRLGSVPLPPYIRAPLADAERYQTIYARVEGSAAAPTAGLHFTPALLAALSTAGVQTATVTLHVGLGTFRPVTVEHPRDHRMHSEWFRIPAATAEAVDACRARGGRVVAVGTTVVRTLEANADDRGRLRPGEAWTDVFILPGWRFRAVDGLLTNFHLPRSTLLMLVSAFAGRDAVLAAYREAVRQRYRFFSFGDAMLVI